MVKSDTSGVTSTSHSNNLIAVLVACTAIFLLLIVTFGTWAKNNIYNTKVFSDHVVSAVQTEPVRNAIAAGATEKIYDGYPIAGRLLANTTESFISSRIASDRAGNVLDKLATNLQERAIRGNTEPVIIDISGYTETLSAIRETIAPESEPKFNIPQGDAARIVFLSGDEIPNLQNAGMVMLAVIPFATLGLIVLAVVSWFKVSHKSRYFKIAGTVILVTGALVMIFTNTTAAQLSLLANTTNQAVVLEAIYSEFVTNLQQFQSVLIGTGLGIIVMASLYDRRQQMGDYVTKLRSKPAKKVA